MNPEAALDGPDVEPISEIAGAAAVAEGASAIAACLSCGADVRGRYCSDCGQKNDDMRRSSLVLVTEFLRETFGYDSRMWRTIGLMAAAPGTVPSDYAQGKRSRYTPPIRFFLATSFLFFVILAATHTLFVAIEVTRKSETEVAADAAAKAAERLATARKRLAEEGRPEAAAAASAAEAALRADGSGPGDGGISCPLNFKVRFFVRPSDVPADQAAWRECADIIVRNADIELDGEASTLPPAERQARGRAILQRALAGITVAVESPERFNREINEWLARILFLMAPILALLIAMFIRGPDALLFDHLVLSLYVHAFGFAAVTTAVLAAMAGAPHAGLAVAIAIGVYFLVALKRAYRRGWVKTAFATAIVGCIYLLVLSGATTAIVFRTVWTGA